MTRVLLTAYGPYDRWQTNASWLALVELTKDLSPGPEVTTRLYPVDFEEMPQRLESDLADGYDFALHLGQAPGATRIDFEAIGLNVGQTRESEADFPLVAGGPLTYRSSLPLADWAAHLRGVGVPAGVSFHAGTFLCNAVLYWSLHTIAAQELPTQATFLHVPMALSQVAEERRPGAAWPSEVVAGALRTILTELIPTVLAR